VLADLTLVMYQTLCYIGADTSDISRNLEPRRSPGTGKLYYRMKFDIVLLFGLTEFKAQIAWDEQVILSSLLSNIYSNVRSRGRKRGMCCILRDVMRSDATTA
jgi:hypothetical protein